MTHQLDRLADDLGLLSTLLRWLLPRCQDGKEKSSFDLAVKRLLQSGNRAIALFGVLVRDTEPNQKDLGGRAHAIAGRLDSPTSCRLTALHLPFPIDQLTTRISGGES